MAKDSDFSSQHNKSKSRSRTLLSDFGGGFLEFLKNSLVSEDSQEDLDSLWNRIVRGELSVDSIVHGTVRQVVRGGMQVYIDGSCGVFLPGSLSNSLPDGFEDLVGNEYDFKIREINNERRSIVVSRQGLPNSSFVSLPNVQEEEEPLEMIIKRFSDKKDYSRWDQRLVENPQLYRQQGNALIAAAGIAYPGCKIIEISNGEQSVSECVEDILNRL